MGSSRLPGKVLRSVADRPLLAHVIGRLSLLRHSVTVVVATSRLQQDNAIVDWCANANIAVFRGSELDVLDRYWQCVCDYDFAHVVRLTADNPFTDMEELGRLIELHVAGAYDYSHAFGQLPVGVGGEIFTREALQRSHAEGHEANHREHVNEFIQERPKSFRIAELDVPPAKQAPELRLTVDTQEDWARACKLAEQAPGRWLKTIELIDLCSRFA